MANIPQVDQAKTFAVGVGLGSFRNQSALALGASYRISQNAVIKASASTSTGGHDATVYGVGAGFSW
ncbi:MAG: YadA C-terminal domain-containing protein [Gammaproteobacteria bacterium]|nr:YadA C-terminal domain-containing protein [Gammaproteobacteria bacterium]